MLKKVFFPNSTNYYVWINSLLMLLLLAVNLAEPITIVFAYFFETIIIGIFHILKLWLVITKGSSNKQNGKRSKSFGLIPFFIFHYGMFVLVQSIFVFSFFESSVPGISNGFNIIHNFGILLNEKGMGVILTSIFFTNLAYFYNNFLANEKFREYAADEIFFRPYVRIFIQQFVVVFAGFFFVVFSAAYAAAVLLIFLRLPVDLIIVSIEKKSPAFDATMKKYSKSHDHFLQMKRKYQEFSE
ncbi:DUF6498-containing protein [Aequorivita lipolytica]|uniref:Uncharacterized protein n=1 Tax=Aequorivita lipolytica TaxID=153267 RepID=A0A5C6YTM4_9FLAO|nr:DUF6498-containing protein [Aequorivita lipolytica]TXD70832.1 hypothetical protein ESV24_01710 [Aequorivita lipolytica]SRX49880.1 hypothetical protein AEQU2_00345 [Aequorivita lipolytica]